MIIEHNGEKYVKLSTYNELRSKFKKFYKIMNEFKSTFPKEWDKFQFLYRSVKKS